MKGLWLPYMNSKKYTGIFKIVFSLLISVGFLAAVYRFCGIWFEVNDDVSISELLSGKILGKPEYHCPYVRTMITGPVSLLYRIANKVPWWGILLFLLMAFVIFINIYYVVGFADNIVKVLLIGAFEMAIFVAGIHCFGQAQYTAVAIMLATSGYMALIAPVLKEEKPSWMIFSICELIACALRDSSMMLVQPVCMAAFIGALIYLVVSKKEDLKNCIKKVALCVGIIVSAIVICLIDRAITFHGNEWKNYYKFNSVQAYLTDYERTIPFEELANHLEKYDISNADYIQIQGYRVAYTDNKFTGECLDELLPVLKEIRSNEQGGDYFGEAIKQLLLSSTGFWHLHQFTLILFFASLLIIVMQRKWLHIIPVLTAFSGYLVGIVLLAYRNRFVLRVMMPYYLSALLILGVVIVWTFKETVEDFKGKKPILYLSLIPVIVVILMALQIGRVQFSYVRSQNKHVNAISFSEGREIMDYCRSHQDKNFILDMSYERYVNTDIFEHEYYERANYIYSGSWNTNTPPMLEYSGLYMENGFCYLIYEAQEFRGLAGIEYYAAQMNTRPILEERFKLSSGATIWVYSIGMQQE